eukprot:11239-Heterococcus_DN1.PRE.3
MATEMQLASHSLSEWSVTFGYNLVARQPLKHDKYCRFSGVGSIESCCTKAAQSLTLYRRALTTVTRVHTAVQQE